MKKVYFVRHGESEMNVSGKWAGHIETPLTKKGIEQARATGKTIKKNYPKIDLIVSSPLARALDTAKNIAKEIGYPEDKIILHDIFKERNFGKLEGTFSSEFFTENRTLKDMDNVKGAETIEELYYRSKDGLKYLRSLKHDSILVVGHGSSGRSLQLAAKNMPHHYEYISDKREKLLLRNAEIIELL